MATANCISLQGGLRLWTLAPALLDLIPGYHRLPHGPHSPTIIVASLDISVPMAKIRVSHLAYVQTSNRSATQSGTALPLPTGEVI
jgi:hypothetical protein